MQSAECRVQSAECRVQSAECRVQSAECRMQSAECRVKKRKDKKPKGGLTLCSLASLRLCVNLLVSPPRAAAGNILTDLPRNATLPSKAARRGKHKRGGLALGMAEYGQRGQWHEGKGSEKIGVVFPEIPRNPYRGDTLASDGPWDSGAKSRSVRLAFGPLQTIAGHPSRHPLVAKYRRDIGFPLHPVRYPLLPVLVASLTRQLAVRVPYCAPVFS